ncbi:MAG TPA: dihydrolipoyl dehydrogenase [Propionibacteriaceae bacterium]|nr:dihydrolipoyl dehydrogenase [Propionibacteriaceae bacterium]HPZ49236.1 dihydrolipoyl dehydrogenase [Propionibacteriaceae bacterium]
MADYDVIVIGGGPGGYIAAERLGHAGKKVLLAEKEFVGGTCLNVGCIPTKSLLNSAKLYSHALHSEQFGVSVQGASYDWVKVQAWKEQVVSTLVGGVTTMLKKLKVEIVPEFATLVSAGVVEVGGVRKTADHVIVATGSVPVMPPIPGAKDNPRVVDSTGLLAVTEVPKRLVVIGGGVIGVEFASLFSELGSEVTVVEMLDEIVPFMDNDVAAKLRRSLSKVAFKLGCRVTGVDPSTGSGTGVTYTTKDGKDEHVEADLVLMAVGRRPLVDGWGAKEAGLEVSGKGVVVDDTMRTNLPNVWAVGDVTGRSLLAHAAYRMGEIAVANILDPTAAKRGELMRWDTIPWAVYSIPEAAGVGLTERQAKERGHTVIKATAPLVLSGRFVAENGLSQAGTVKIIADSDSGAVLGIHMLGTYAPETIWGAAAILESDLTVTDLRQVVFPHPTVSEGIREAVWALKV